MKLVVGLGNPGKEYLNTRHNVGFMVLDFFVEDFLLEKKFQALIRKDKIGFEDVIYVKPITFMNLSGEAVGKIAKYYNVLPEDILVIQDDMDLELGSYKLKRNSSSGGHNGIKSIIASLNTDSFLRLKVGISHDRSIETIDYVLNKFSKKELDVLMSNFSIYQDIISSFVVNGVDKTLQEFSKKR